MTIWKTFIQFILSCFLVIAFQSAANESDIHTICKSDYAQCIEQLPSHLNQLKPYGIAWSGLKRSQLDALFSLSLYKQLEHEVKQLIDNPSVQDELKLRSYIYNAKLLVTTDKVQSRIYQDKADKLLALLHNNFQNPRKVIEYANLQIYLENYEKGIALFLALADRFRDHPNTNIKEEIYTNLGNLHFLNNKLPSAISYYEEAYFWARKNDNKQRIAMTHYNLARGHQQSNKLDEAIDIFMSVEKYTIKNNIRNLFFLTHLRVAQILAKQNKWEYVATHLDKVELGEFSTVTIDTYNQLRQQLANQQTKK